MIERRAWSLIIGSLVWSVAPSAHGAPTRDECVAASEDAQTQKITSHLRAAHDQLVVCSDDACPKLVRQDCRAWLDEVERALPTVVFGVRNGDGKDIADVRVSVDGVVVTEHLDGKAVVIDAGEHTLLFESNGLPTHEQKIIVNQGEKNRVVNVTLGEPTPPPVAPPPPPVAPPAPMVVRVPEKRVTPPSPVTWVVGGLGLAVLGAAGITGLVALDRRASLLTSCYPNCELSVVDGVYTMYDLAYAGAAIGGALVVTSAILFFATKSAHTTIVVSPTASGISVAGRF